MSNDRVARIQAEWARERPDVDTGPQGVIGRLHRIANHLTSELTLLYAQYGLSEGRVRTSSRPCVARERRTSGLRGRSRCTRW